MDVKKIVSEVTILAPVPIKSSQKSNFGQKRSYEIHPGVDLPVPVGTEVLAPMDGVVKLADFNFNRLCGATIDIDYGNGFSSRFCHMSRIDVSEGDEVSQGQVVGLSGGKQGALGSGNSQGPHLHFTLKKNGDNVDPLSYINKTVPDLKEPEDVKKVASKLGKDEIDFEELKKTIKPGQLGKMFTQGIQSIFKEEVERIKQLMK